MSHVQGSAQFNLTPKIRGGGGLNKHFKKKWFFLKFLQGITPVFRSKLHVMLFNYIIFDIKKNHICFENTQRRSPTIHVWCRILQPGSFIESRLHLNQRFLVGIIYVGCFLVSAVSLWSKNYFWPGDLDLWPMTLNFELDLDILPFDLHAKIQVCTSVRSAVRARQTDRQTHRKTMPKLLHPSLALGVIRNHVV